MDSNDAPDQRTPELLASLTLPPRLVPVGTRVEFDDRIVVVSHVEIWTWRVVLRGMHADRRRRPRPTSPLVPGKEAADRDQARALLRQDGRERTAETRRLMEWSLIDDVGTVYRRVSGGVSSAGDAWSLDFRMHFAPVPPPDALSLTFDGLMGPASTFSSPTTTTRTDYLGRASTMLVRFASNA